MCASQRVLFRHASQRERLTRKACQQHIVRRNGIANVFGGLFIADASFVAQRDITNIRVELVRVGVAIPVGFIGTDGMFIPFTGEHTLPANSFKAMANAADTGKEIDKSKGIIRMRSRRTRQQVAQITELAVAQAVPCPVAYQQPLEYRRAPVTLAMGHQLVCQRFSIIHFQQLTQECLHGCR